MLKVLFTKNIILRNIFYLEGKVISIVIRSTQTADQIKQKLFEKAKAGDLLNFLSLYLISFQIFQKHL